jgi:hypothetical protein
MGNIDARCCRVCRTMAESFFLLETKQGCHSVVPCLLIILYLAHVLLMSQKVVVTWMLTSNQVKYSVLLPLPFSFILPCSPSSRCLGPLPQILANNFPFHPCLSLRLHFSTLNLSPCHVRQCLWHSIMCCLQAIEAVIMYWPFCGLMYTFVPSLSLKLILACSMNIIHVDWYLASPTCSQAQIHCLHICHSYNWPWSCHHRPLHPLHPLSGRPFCDFVQSPLSHVGWTRCGNGMVETRRGHSDCSIIA